MWIRSNELLFDTDKIQKISVRNNRETIDVCVTLVNEPGSMYPIYTGNTRDAAANMLARLQEAISLNYKVFDVRLQIQADEKPKKLYETGSGV